MRQRRARTCTRKRARSRDALTPTLILYILVVQCNSPMYLVVQTGFKALVIAVTGALPILSLYLIVLMQLLSLQRIVFAEHLPNPFQLSNLQMLDSSQ